MDRPDAGLEVYAIRGTQRTLEVELVSHRDAQPLAYRTAFARLLSEHALAEDAAICAWLRENGVGDP